MNREAGMTPGVRRLDSARTLRAAGLRDEIHPRDVACFAFPDRETFEASAKRDRENHGNAVHGPYETEAGTVGITDMRPQLRAMGAPATDPAEPDDFLPGPA